ncbi:MAG: PIG-L family deacetylase [Kiritimatiellae bacterium]|nr:PIG-L family deacetylase [Kiritimatiellia bacterium]
MRDNPYREFVEGYVRLMERGRAVQRSELQFPSPPAPSAGSPVLMLFSPHPDDEAITGALPLRLARESGVRVINVAVTLGSNVARREGRLAELTEACRYLGFELRLSRPGGLEKINPKGRAEDRRNWAEAVRLIADILVEVRPQAVLFPHEHDWNSTHIGTHLLVREALAAAALDPAPLAIESEFWAPMAAPNLMIESTVADVADLVAAVSLHAGEVSRNPYHLTLPAWMQDNVRRGAEIVGGQGGAAPAFVFATLYRAGVWRGQQWSPAPRMPRIVGARDRLDLW